MSLRTPAVGDFEAMYRQIVPSPSATGLRACDEQGIFVGGIFGGKPARTFHIQLSTAVPWIIAVEPIIIEVEPIATGILAVIVTGPPAIKHCAVPELLMVAIVVFDDIQVRPFDEVSICLMLLLNVPIAVN